ncbi:hypothetical protein BH11PSE8_BH11PSE8_33820 [soil metagenome]
MPGLHDGSRMRGLDRRRLRVRLISFVAVATLMIVLSPRAEGEQLTR